MGLETFFWKKWLTADKVEYLKKNKVGVVGSRLLAELLWRSGVGCIRYVGDHITASDVSIDPVLNVEEANSYDDMPPKKEGVEITTYTFPEDDYLAFKRQLRGADVIVAHKHMELSSNVAEDLGVPFIPEIITTFLPDGIKYCAVRYEKPVTNPVIYTLTCAVQAGEIIRILTGYGLPVIAPTAYVVDFGSPGYLRQIRLKAVR